MIVFLTLCYIAVLVLLVKANIIKLTLFWKISPLIWMVLLFVALFIPMQWGAPSGTLTNYQYVVEIVPNVAGEVVDVVARPSQPLKRGDVLFRIDPRPYQYRVDQLRASLAKADQEVPQLAAGWEASKQAVEKARAERNEAKLNMGRAKRLLNTQAGSEVDYDMRKARYDSLVAAVKQLEAQQERAKLAYTSEIDGVNTTVAEIQAQLKEAEYNLDQTTVRAPADGYIMGLGLSVGQRVSTAPMRGWMPFVVRDGAHLIAWINQNVYRYVKVDAPVEAVFKLYPGRVFSGKVEAMLEMSGEGQLQASGSVPTRTVQQQPGAFAVIIKLDEPAEIEASLPVVPGGALGTAAVYTESAKATQVIRKIMLRMEAWINYIQA